MNEEKNGGLLLRLHNANDNKRRVEEALGVLTSTGTWGSAVLTLLGEGAPVETIRTTIHKAPTPGDLSKRVRNRVKRAARTWTTTGTLPYRVTVDTRNTIWTRIEHLTEAVPPPHIIQPSRETDNELLLVLSRRWLEDEARGLPVEVRGWMNDDELIKGIWGRTTRGASAHHVAIYRVRQRANWKGYDAGLIQKERQQTRLAVEQVVML